VDIEFILIVSFMSMFAFVFLILGLTEKTFPSNIIFHMLNVAVSYTACLMVLGMTEDQWSLVFSQVFLLFGTISFVFVIIIGVMAMNVKRNQNNIFR
jgi:hypothetical protein